MVEIEHAFVSFQCLDFKHITHASTSPPLSMNACICSSTLNFSCVKPSHSTASPIRNTLTSFPCYIAVTANRIAFQAFSYSFVSIRISVFIHFEFTNLHIPCVNQSHKKKKCCHFSFNIIFFTTFDPIKKPISHEENLYSDSIAAYLFFARSPIQYAYKSAFSG